MPHALQETFLQFGLEALARGYAVLAYDGPGQGAVLKNDPHMPFYAGQFTFQLICRVIVPAHYNQRFKG